MSTPDRTFQNLRLISHLTVRENVWLAQHMLPGAALLRRGTPGERARAEKVEALLEAERNAPPAPSDAKARLLSRLEQSLFDGASPEPGENAGDAGEAGNASDAADLADVADAVDAMEATAAAVKVAGGAAGIGAKSAVVATVAAVKLTVGVGVASFVAGGAVGAGMHAALTKPSSNE